MGMAMRIYFIGCILFLILFVFFGVMTYLTEDEKEVHVMDKNSKNTTEQSETDDIEYASTTKDVDDISIIYNIPKQKQNNLAIQTKDGEPILIQTDDLTINIVNGIQTNITYGRDVVNKDNKKTIKHVLEITQDKFNDLNTKYLAEYGTELQTVD